MMASHDAGAGDADFCGDQGAPAASLFESAGQATALSRVDMPVTAGVIIDVATSAGSAAPNFYGRLMVPMPDPAVAKPDPARMELFLAGRLTIDRVEQPGAIATQDVPAKSGS